MEWFLGWVILSFIVAYVAGQKGRSGVGMFFMSMLLSPLIGILVVIALPARSPETGTDKRGADDYIICWKCRRPRKNTGRQCPHCGAANDPGVSGTKSCPFCAETIQAAAVKCRFCHSDLSAVPEASVKAPAVANGMGYCPGCSRLRAFSVSKCVYCGSTDAVRTSK